MIEQLESRTYRAFIHTPFQYGGGSVIQAGDGANFKVEFHDDACYDIKDPYDTLLYQDVASGSVVTIEVSDGAIISVTTVNDPTSLPDQLVVADQDAGNGSTEVHITVNEWDPKLSIGTGGGNDTIDIEKISGQTLIGGNWSANPHDVIDTGAGDDLVDLSSYAMDNGSSYFGVEVLTGDGDDYVIGSDGGDWISTGADSDSVYAGAGADTVLGGDDADTIYGDIGNDSLYGGEGNDSISGEANNDTLCGEDGNDTLNGGSGADLFYGDDLTPCNDVFYLGDGSGTDTIGDKDYLDTVATSDTGDTW